MEQSFDRDSFYTTLWKLMLPIVLQNLVSAIVSTADVLMMDEFVKLPFAAARFRRYKWLNDLTRDEKER